MSLNINTNATEKCENGVEFEILLDGNGTGAFLTVVGSESKLHTKNARKFVQESELAKETLADDELENKLDELEIALIVGTITNWRGIVDDNEKSVVFTQKKALKLIKDNRWIRLQINPVVLKMGKFLGV